MLKMYCRSSGVKEWPWDRPLQAPLIGDTVATVLVGGMMTVMNGHFEMFAGPSPPTDSCARSETRAC